MVNTRGQAALALALDAPDIDAPAGTAFAKVRKTARATIHVLVERADRQTAPMIIHDREYIKPSKAARVLSILQALSLDSDLSQLEIGHRSGLSGAMVNQYLRELSSQDLVRYVPANGKSFHYVLSEQGEAMRRKMFATFSGELVRLYSSLKLSIREKLLALERKGVRKVVLFGASETCEVLLSALRDSAFEVVAVLDNDPEKQGKRFHGQIIASPRILDGLACQAVIVTSFGHQDEIREQLTPLAATSGMEIVLL